MDVEQFLRLKRTLTHLKEQASKLAGGREVLLERLKKEFNCSSVSEAKILEQKLAEEIKAKGQEYQSLCEAWERDFNAKSKQ